MGKVCVQNSGKLVLLVSAVILIPSVGLANKTVDFRNNLCHANTKSQERIGGIPADLLTSISLAETGRWNPKNKEMFAWPWTVTWGGKGRYFPTKKSAVNAVAELQYSGVKISTLAACR